MPTLLIKNVPEELLRELRKLKVELNCKTWSDLLEKLVQGAHRSYLKISEEEEASMREGVKEFLRLRRIVSEKWKGPPSVLEEIRRMREHER